MPDLVSLSALSRPLSGMEPRSSSVEITGSIHTWKKDPTSAQPCLVASTRIWRSHKLKVRPVTPDLDQFPNPFGIVFAPIMLVIPYDSIDEAIAIANGTRYGLGAAVFGPDQKDCLTVARLLECGMVSVNDFAITYLNQDMPFGGVKGSGYGRFAGPEGLRGLCNSKAIVVDRWPWLVQTSIPRTLDYPIRSLVQSW